MQPLRDRQSGRFLTSLLAFALAVFSFLLPAASASTASTHACCVRLKSACPAPMLQCCARPVPNRTPQGVPPPTSSAPSPDPVALLTVASTPPAPMHEVLCSVIGPPHTAVPPLLYLRHSSLLV
jgi:hypothetical protein